VALAGAVQALESLVPSPVPWFRLGLANAFVLLAFCVWDLRAGFGVALGKVLVGGLLAGRLLSPAFFLSLGGTLAAAAAMALAVRFLRPLGFVGVSALGAQFHALGQLLLAALLLRTPAVWSLAPLVGVLSVFAGAVTGLVAHRIFLALDAGDEDGARDPIPADP
jgi:heptaprenyl diphosphate synthase